MFSIWFFLSPVEFGFWIAGSLISITVVGVGGYLFVSSKLKLSLDSIPLEKYLDYFIFSWDWEFYQIFFC